MTYRLVSFHHLHHQDLILMFREEWLCSSHCFLCLSTFSMPSLQTPPRQTDSMPFKHGWLPVSFSSLVCYNISTFLMGIHICFILIAGALFEYSVILLRMKIKTIRQIRKCLNGNLAAYLAPLANPLGASNTMQNGAVNRQTQGMVKDISPILAPVQIPFTGGTSFPAFDPTSKVDLVFLCCFPCLFLIFSIVYVIAFYFWERWNSIILKWYMK